ncbi:hypothetical protein AeMF1_006420 [Aphanomyces euteiches]|nr:hypothetical protein AeMF1_006420 [Aphanomyces euteiches]
MYQSGLNVIKKWIINHGNPAMLDPIGDPDGEINLESFKYEDFLAFIEWTIQNTSNKPGTLCGYRSALRDYYKQKKIPYPVEFEDDMKEIFQGIRRVHAESTQHGDIRDVGKKPLGFSIYSLACKNSLMLLDGGFAHLFLTLTWNLMCWSNSTQTVRIEHLSYEEDALGVTFYKSKTDQSGTKRRDPKHVYANPLEPDVCVVLALGIYFACNPGLETGCLFPGSNQRDRFGKTLQQLVERSVSNHGKLEFGTHSIRKGVATFACSGHVLERYMHYERAGDQFLGRVVAGLPMDSTKFAQLPPHFPLVPSSLVTTSIDIMFPHLARLTSMRLILSMCLASLVHHGPNLVSVLPKRHALLSTHLFRSNDTMNALRQDVLLDSTFLKSTGIPPHVALYACIAESQNAIQALPDVIVDRVGELIEEKGVAAGNITHALLKSTITEAMQQSNYRSPPDQPPSVFPPPLGMYVWGERFRRLPIDFVFPSVGPTTAWELWWRGNASSNLPPFRHIHPEDLKIHAQRSQLVEWKLVMKHFEDVCAESGLNLSRNLSDDELIISSRMISGYLQTICTAKSDKRRRRVPQLKLMSIVRDVRPAIKKRKVDE